MENNGSTNVMNTEPYERTSQKIGKHLRATHYKLGGDGNKILYNIIFNYVTNKNRLGSRK
jgi:hypothetical protein